MGPILTLTFKDLRLLFRDKPGFFFTFAFPLLYAIFFGTMMSGFGGEVEKGERTAIRILIVDEDGTENSAALAKALDDTDELDTVPIETADEARDLVREGRNVACLIIPEGYGEATQNLFWGDPRKLELLYDPSRSIERTMIEGMLMGIAYQPLQEMFKDPNFAGQTASDAIEQLQSAPDMDPVQRDKLIEGMQFLRQFSGILGDLTAGGASEGGENGNTGGFKQLELESNPVVGGDRDDGWDGPKNSFSIAFPQATVWGVMGAAAAFGISLVTERSGGTLTRLRSAPITREQVLLGKAGACFITSLTVMAMLFVFATTVFGVRPGWEQAPKLIMALVCIAICFVGIMMMLSVVGRTEAAAGGIGWAVLIVFAMFGGAMIPLIFMKGWMYTAGNFSPIKWAIVAMEGAVWRGFSYGQMVKPCLILVATGVVGFFAGAQIWRRIGDG